MAPVEHHAVTLESLARDHHETGEDIASISERVDKIAATQLTAEDVQALRVIIEQDKRTRWLWSTARAWALWVSAVVAGATIGMDALKTALKRLIA